MGQHLVLCTQMYTNMFKHDASGFKYVKSPETLGTQNRRVKCMFDHAGHT